MGITSCRPPTIPAWSASSSTRLPSCRTRVFIDAAAFLPHLDQDEYPAQTLAAEIFLECGERGNVSAGRDPRTGLNRRPRLELVRLTLPRRVYTESHLHYTAESIRNVFARRHSIRGLRITWEPDQLRFVQSRFESVGDREPALADDNAECGCERVKVARSGCYW